VSGVRIEAVLYDEDGMARRDKFHRERISYFSNGNRENFPPIYLATFNLKLNGKREHEQKLVEEEEYAILDGEWHFDSYSQELPICIIVPSFNNNDNFRLEYNLNSLFQQNYSNYFAVVINDASTHNSDSIFTRYFAFHDIDQKFYVYINNRRRLTSL
jgi:hypothetical protein